MTSKTEQSKYDINADLKDHLRNLKYKIPSLNATMIYKI